MGRHSGETEPNPLGIMRRHTGMHRDEPVLEIEKPDPDPVREMPTVRPAVRRVLSGHGPRAAVTGVMILLLVGTCRAADHRAAVPVPSAVATSKPPSERPQLANGGQTEGTPYPSLPVTTGHVEGRSDPPRTSPPVKVTVTAAPHPGPTVTVTRLVRTPARVRPGPTVTIIRTVPPPAPAPEVGTPGDTATP